MPTPPSSMWFALSPLRRGWALARHVWAGCCCCCWYLPTWTWMATDMRCCRHVDHPLASNAPIMPLRRCNWLDSTSSQAAELEPLAAGLSSKQGQG
ncbi:hypothetical protein IWX91DRAFT_66383 [Phyllosticta citricarpa]